MVNEKHVVVSPCGQYIKTLPEVGKGTNQIVWTGYDVRKGRCVAWCEPKCREKKAWDWFIKTSSLLENLQHNHIIPFVDFWEASPSTSRTPVLITELMSCTLKRHIKMSPRSFQDVAIRNWAHQVFDAIRYLHTGTHHAIVHRSVRLSHVYINITSGDVKLGSFANATALEKGKCLDEQIELDVAFMSPEMVREQYTESHDIYTYGLFLLEMITQEDPYDESDKLSDVITWLKTEVYPKSLEKVTCYVTKELIKGCLNHNLSERFSLSMIATHRFFQVDEKSSINRSVYKRYKALPNVKLPNGVLHVKNQTVGDSWPKIQVEGYDGEQVKISIAYPDTQQDQLYSFNLQTDHYKYVAASLVRAEYIKECHLQDASIHLHKIIEKVKRQTRIKNEILPAQDFYPITQPIMVNNTKPSKTTKGVNLTLCQYEDEDSRVELELMQPRSGKVVKFQFGVMDNEAEEIADNLINQGHLIPENRDDFLQQLTEIIKKYRRPSKEQDSYESDNNSQSLPNEGIQNGSSSHSASPITEPSDLAIDFKRRLSREPSGSNNISTEILSPDFDTRSLQSETSKELQDLAAKPLSSNGVDSLVSPPIISARSLPLNSSSYYRPPITSQPNMMFYPPQPYMILPGNTSSHHVSPHSMPPSNYVVMPHPSPALPPGSVYTNGHIASWAAGQIPPGGMPAGGNAMRIPVNGSTGGIQFITDRNSETPPPTSLSVMSPIECRSDT